MQTTLLFVGVILGSPAFGWFSDHLGRRILPMIVGAIFSLAVMLVLLYVPDLKITSNYYLILFGGVCDQFASVKLSNHCGINPIALTSTAVSVDSIYHYVKRCVMPTVFWLDFRNELGWHNNRWYPHFIQHKTFYMPC